MDGSRRDGGEYAPMKGGSALMGDLSKNFSKDEFKCGNARKDCCGLYIPSGELIRKLQKLRDKVGLKIVVNSGTRCVLRNIQVGGSDNSSHLRGLAADITCSDMMLLLRCALGIFSRVGISGSYIHVDVDEDKPQGIYWVYVE